MIIPDRKRCARPKNDGVRPGYGERKRKREQARYPLFSEDPAIIDPAEVYEQRMDALIRAAARRDRQQHARDWRTIRRWLRCATAEKRALWYARWTRRWAPPHDAYNAVSLAFRIDHPEPCPGMAAWESWAAEWRR